MPYGHSFKKTRNKNIGLIKIILCDVMSGVCHDVAALPKLPRGLLSRTNFFTRNSKSYSSAMQRRIRME